MTLFRDRSDAGIQLAFELKKLSFLNPIVIALPRGGVPVAKKIAEALGAPLDVLIVRKIGAPGQNELGVGATTEGGLTLYNTALMHSLGVKENTLRSIVQKEAEEVNRRISIFRHGRALPDMKDRDVILVDDGLATGYTAAVAGKYLHERGAARVILAVPVAAEDSARFLENYVDQVLCLRKPEPFYSVGLWYEDFTQTSDQEVVSLLNSSSNDSAAGSRSQEVLIANSFVRLPGALNLPERPVGFVLFAHGSGSGRFSPRNLAVAKVLNEAGIGTLLFDLLTAEENQNRANVFDIPLLAGRLKVATEWIRKKFPAVSELPLGYFGASTGGGAALWAAADRDEKITAVVSRGGRPDLAMAKLDEVRAPTLLIVGGNDKEVIHLNERALSHLRNGELILIPGATHVFEEPGALEEVASLARDWFLEHFEDQSALRQADEISLI